MDNIFFARRDRQLQPEYGEMWDGRILSDDDKVLSGNLR